MTESGFVKAQSDNLPKVDAFMVHEYFSSNKDYSSAEIKAVKAARSERENYGDAAIGYVQLERAGAICIVKACITPEHNVHKQSYTVVATCDEEKEEVVSVQCEDCPAHNSLCKHAIAFLAWLHRRSEEPPSTSVECYWRRSKLSSVGTSLKFIKAKDLRTTQRTAKTEAEGDSHSFLDLLKTKSVEVGDTNNQLTKYFKIPSNAEKLSIHYMANIANHKNADDFLEFCKKQMAQSDCEVAERATIEQSNSALWHELRYGRITASKAYEAAHCSTFEGSLTESILGARTLRDTKEMQRGRNLEEQVLKHVERVLK